MAWRGSTPTPLHLWLRGQGPRPCCTPALEDSRPPPPAAFLHPRSQKVGAARHRCIPGCRVSGSRALLHLGSSAQAALCLPARALKDPLPARAPRARGGVGARETGLCRFKRGGGRRVGRKGAGLGGARLRLPRGPALTSPSRARARRSGAGRPQRMAASREDAPPAPAQGGEDRAPAPQVSPRAPRDPVLGSGLQPPAPPRLQPPDGGGSSLTAVFSDPARSCALWGGRWVLGSEEGRKREGEALGLP